VEAMHDVSGAMKGNEQRPGDTYCTRIGCIIINEKDNEYKYK